MNKIRELSIYYKIIITFLLVIIPLYAFTLFLNELSTESLRQEIMGSMSSRVHFYTETLERELDNIYSLQNNLALDRKFQRYGVAGNYISSIERRDLVYDIQRQLLLIKSSNHYIEEVRVHFLNIGKTITAEDLYSDLNPVQVELLLRASPDEPLLYMDGKLFLRMTYPEPLLILGEQKTPLFLIETEISVAALQETLSEFSINGPDTVFLTNRDKEWMISNRPLENTALQKHLEQQLSTSESNPVFQTSFAGDDYLVASEKSDSYRFFLMSSASEDTVIRPVKEFQNWFWWLSLLTLIIVLLFSYSIKYMIHKPIKTLIRSFRKVEAGRFEVRVSTNTKDEFSYLYGRFNLMLEQINHLIETVYEQKIRTQQAELKHLQSQINPHFLYNSLFVLHQMVVMQDYENLEHFSKNLSDYFKMITRNAVQEVSVEEEVRYAKNYVNIQEFRFSNRVKVTFEDVPEGVQKFKVPRLILQPLIENAFEHGMKNRLEDGLIHVGFKLKDDLFRITVEDNGEALEMEDEMHLQELLARKNEDLEGIESTGLINVHQRLLLKYGPLAGLRLESSPGTGFQVIITIPVKEEIRDVSDHGRR